MIPAPFTALVLALAAYRITRLIGWDDFPPVARVRAWITGESWDQAMSINQRMGVTELDAPSEPTHKRPVLAHFLHCPFCQGAWTSFTIYVLWLELPTPTLYVSAALALSAAVGLISKNLDP